jgi:hypothetical protein
MLTQERLHKLLDYDCDTGVFTWKVSKGTRKAGDTAGTVNKKDGYIRLMIDGVNYVGHRLAWFYVHGEWPTGLVDHRDHDRQNNAIDNLRQGTRNQNNADSSLYKNNTSGFKGVSWHKPSRRWVAFISIEGKNKNLGYFDDPELAHIAYKRAARNQFGEYAKFR